jgi:hypothetical protein
MDRWEDCGPDSQAMILGFDQIRDHDEQQAMVAASPYR